MLIAKPPQIKIFLNILIFVGQNRMNIAIPE